MEELLLFSALGIGSGAVYALLAHGIMLEFRSSGFVNFGHAAMAMFLAYVFSELRLTGELLLPVVGLPDRLGLSAGPMDTIPAAILTIAYGGALGAVIYMALFRWIRHAPALAKVVASVGVLLALQALAVLKFGTVTRTVPRVLPGEPMTVAGVTFPRDRLWLAGVAIVAAVCLVLVYRRTRFGMASRAAAEDETAAGLVGLSADRLAVGNWAIATMLAALAGLLVAPITALNPATYSLFIVPALGAALLGRLTSFGAATAGALALGIAQAHIGRLQATWHWLPQQGLQGGLPFVVILVTMAVAGRTIPSRGTIVTQRLPVASLPTHPWRTAAVGLPAGLVLIHVADGAWRLALLQGVVTSIILLSLVVLTGYVGQISFAQASFAGLGGFIVAKLATSAGIPFPVAPLLAGLAVVPVGVLVGLPALRIRGVNLAIITLAAAVAIDEFVFRIDSLTGGVRGSTVEPPRLFGIDLSITGHRPGEFPRAAFGYVALGTFTALALGVAHLRASGLGRRMLAVRANERSAAALGINVASTKLLAFGISAFIAGVGGAITGYQQRVLSFESFGVLTSLVIVTVAYVGGIGRISGALVGGALAAGGLGPTALQRLIGLGEYEILIVGVILMYSAVRHPDGISHLSHTNRERTRHRRARARPATALAPGHGAA